MTFIIFILLIVGFVYLLTRIQALEARIENPGAFPIPSQPYQQMPQAMPVQSQPVQATAETVPQPPAKDIPKRSAEEEGGKWLGKIGIAAVFIGMAFFLKYAFDNNIIGPLGRVIIGVIVGIAFAGIGWINRKKYTQFAYVLIGGGVAILYLSFFAAYTFYHLINQPVAFIFMILTTLATVALGLLDESIGLVVIAVVGGFLTPHLVPSQENNMFLLFTYIALLDVGAIALALRNKWFPIAYIAMGGTVISFLGWYGEFYSKDQLWVTIYFLTVFYGIFLAFTVLRHIWKKELSNGGDLTLVTVNALGYFMLLLGMLDPQYHDWTWALSFIFSVIYYALAFGVFTLNKSDRAMSAYLAAFGTLFLTLTIPLKLHDSWITVAWLVESMSLYAIGFYIKRESLHIYGAVIYLIAILKLFVDYSMHSHGMDYVPFANQYFVLFIIAIAMAYVIAYLYTKNPSVIMNTSAPAIAGTFIVAANIMTIGLITSEISGLYGKSITGYGDYESNQSLMNQQNTVVSIFWTLYSLALIAIGFAWRIKIFRIMGLIFFFLTAFKIFIDVWSLGPLYRIVSSIIFGIVALLASFAYAKYKDAIRDMISE